MLYIVSISFIIIYGIISPNHPDPNDFTLSTGPLQALVITVVWTLAVLYHIFAWCEWTLKGQFTQNTLVTHPRVVPNP